MASYPYSRHESHNLVGGNPISRRCFMRTSAGGLMLIISGCGESPTFDRSCGAVVLGDPALCGACGRCAMTCHYLNFANSVPGGALVDPEVQYQTRLFTDGRWFAETCRMCPIATNGGELLSPACVAACSSGAAKIADQSHPTYGKLRVRYIDPEKCLACGSCGAACPFHHPLLYADAARKCELCLERFRFPPCVEQCPSSALCYLSPWTDQSPRPFPWENSL